MKINSHIDIKRITIFIGCLSVITTIIISLNGCVTSVCSDCDGGFHGPAPDPFVFKEYDSTRVGVQITYLFWDEQWSLDYSTVNDEFIRLQSDTTRSIKGWTLNAADTALTFALPDTLFKDLTIYTHIQPDSTSKTQWSLRLPPKKWIWSNAKPDTARLYDASHKLVDSLSYRVQ